MNDSQRFANLKAGLTRVQKSAGYLITIALTTREQAISTATRRHKKRTVLLLMTFGVVLFFVLCAAVPIWSQQSAHDEHEGMSMSADEPGPTDATLLSWKRESEGNHHLIGFFLALSGLFILAQGTVTKRFPLVAYVWPACFVLSGLFVLVYSDTELWPFGPKPWIQGTITNPEVIQHKIFAILLLVVGLIETERVRRHLTEAWLGWIFPVLAMAGSVLLLFHSHNAGMHGPDHMAVMERIQSEHFSYAAAGFGIGLAKGLAEIPTKWQVIFAKGWPTLMVVLGVLLMRYVE
jgi:putative copper resistance protein D